MARSKEELRQYHQEWYQKNKDHTEELRKARVEDRKANGECIQCGEPNDRLGLDYCSKCDKPRAKTRKVRYHRNKEAGACVWCGGERDRGDLLLCLKCEEEDKIRRKQPARLKSKADSLARKRKVWKKEGLCRCCGAERDRDDNTECAVCRERRKHVGKKRDLVIRNAVLEAYGGCKCSCECGCGETVRGFMTLDHSLNDGAKHGQKITTTLTKWLFKNGFPQDIGIRVMCWNCNSGRAKNDGVCPRFEMQQSDI